MFPNATISSRSSSSRSGHSCTRNSSMPSLRIPNSLIPKTSFNPLFSNSDAFTSFDASHFAVKDNKVTRSKHLGLRRYNSQESHSDCIEISSNSKDNTPESTKSRSGTRTTPETSPASTEERDRRQGFEARDFLEKYSLPRIVRVENGEPLLLYRCFDSFTKVQARGLAGKRGKERADLNILHFPEGYSGWFSLANEKGEKTAVTHSSLLQLVREQVCSFISVQPFTAYTAGNQDSSDVSNARAQYLKTQIRGGQVFQLRAVFQHRDRPDGGRHHSTKSSRISRSARDKDLANRYAQLIGQNNQELYVPLTTKGEFYETYSSIKAKLCFAGMIDKTGPLALDRDCLYKLAHLLRRVAMPLRVKLIAGPLPQGTPKDFTDTFILEKKFQEPLMVTCTLPPPSENIKHEISCINLNSRVKIAKCTLGFDSENRLFKSQRVQAAMAFCHKNVETWYREVRLFPNLPPQVVQHNKTSNLPVACDDCRKLNQYCSENCVNNRPTKDITTDSGNKQLITKEVIDKFPKPKKWYRHFKLLSIKGESNSVEKYQDIKDPMDGIEKVKSIERYKDMSKLIEDRFGKKSYNPVKKSASFMYSNKRMNLEETPTDKASKPALLKCQSLDNQIYSGSNEKHLQMFKHHLDRKISNASDNLSSEFQMCILENEDGFIDRKKSLVTSQGQSLKDLTSINLQVTTINFDEIKPMDNFTKLKKTKPDLIPTLPKKDNSYITERLCSEFHVKTKVQKKNYNKQFSLASIDNLKNLGKITEKHGFSIFDDYYQNNETKNSFNTKSVTVQVHEESLPKTKKLAVIEDVPYSHVADELHQKTKPVDENIYSEICEDTCNCDSIRKCECSRTTRNNSEYCYLKLGSNGDSIVSDSDEAIYNTLR